MLLIGAGKIMRTAKILLSTHIKVIVVDSIKNPKSGVIKVPGVKEVIMDDPNARGEIISNE